MSIDVHKAKTEAIERAAKSVANMLQHPDSLDKVEQLRRRHMRNKASVEARLKAAVQSQLDGVRTGLHQLQSALIDVREIKKSMEQVDTKLKNVSGLAVKLEVVKENHKQQAQLAKACQHVNQIFTVPESVKKTQNLVNEGKLLVAHKCLSDLEATRDELLFEVTKMSQEEGGSKTVDKTPLYQYFADVIKVSESLGKQLWIVMGRILSTVRSDPGQLVTALRIIEREERADRRAEDLKERNVGFDIPGRPKQWREKCYEVLQESVNNRFESLEMGLQDRFNDNMWLVKHLERTRQRVFDDLIVVKNLCQPCFPPHYKIFDKYVKMYHKGLSAMLEKVVCEQQLDSNECVSLLTWIRQYGGPELMMHPELMIDVGQFLGPLLSTSVEKELLDTYLTTTENNMKEWMSKLIQTDLKDWQNEEAPETDLEGFYNTSMPVFLFKMVDQNLQVAAQAGEVIRLKVLDISIDKIQGFQREYRGVIRSFKAKHFEDRSQPPRFIEYMIAIVNNCQTSIDFSVQLQERMMAELGKGRFGEDRVQTFKSVVECFDKIGQESCGFLLEEVFLDLTPYFTQIFTPNWARTSVAVDTIVATTEDYYNDFVHMKHKFFDVLMEQALKNVIVEYIKAMMSKRIVFTKYEERKDAAIKIVEEARKFENMFNKMARQRIQAHALCSVLPTLGEVIKLKDTSMMALEISGIANKYPDFKSDHALALLVMRGDVSRSEARQLILETPLEERQGQVEDQDEATAGFFSQIIVPPSLFDKFDKLAKGMK